MYHIFEKTFEKESQIEEYIYERIDDYTRNTKSDIDTINVIRYIMVLKEYIEEKCPRKERNTVKLISLIGSSIDESGSNITPIDIIFSNLLNNNPGMYLPIKYALIKSLMDNTSLYDMLLFFKYNLLSTITSESSNKKELEDNQAKYKNEMQLLDKFISKVEKILDDEEDEQEGVFVKDKEVPNALLDKINEFIKKYKPHKIKEYLDRKIIGQDEAKKTMSVAIYNHMILLAHPELKMKKNNVLMIGPSGCGKTEIMRVLSEIVPVPISIFDTSGISQNGWKGDKKIKDAVKELVLKVTDASSAECGIIFLDEFDKMCRPAFTSHNENVSLHIQGEALAMIEGCDVEVSIGGEDMFSSSSLINTKNILFVCAGAFQGIEETVKKQRNKNSSIGFGGIAKDVSDEITAKDITKETIMEFGVTPELAGRLSLTTVLHKLTKDDMYSIVTKCEDNVLDELKRVAKTGYGIDVEIPEETLLVLIDKLCMDVGARGIRSVFYETFIDILFEVSSKTNTKKVVLNKDLVADYIDKISLDTKYHIKNIISDKKEQMEK